MAFRGTSKYFGGKIDKLYFRHGALTQPFEEYWLHLSVKDIATAAPMHLYGLKVAGLSVEILDVDGRNFPTAPRAYHSYDPLGCLPNLKIIRRIGWNSRSAKLIHNHPLDVVIDYIDLDRCRAMVGATLHLIPQAEGHVVHIKWTWDNIPGPSIRVFMVPAAGAIRLREVVVVLWPPSTPPTADFEDDDEPLFWYIVRELSPFMGAGGTVKVVGLENVPRQGLSLAPHFTTTYENNAQAWYQGVFAYLVDEEWFHLGDENLSCHTLEEWWAEIGDDKNIMGSWVEKSSIKVEGEPHGP
ncbi:uncharacterized protein LOC62_04G005308 [Vanrija pseudolonga]|uniref:Uncharacterized protein n=1 Tax=Vanrija pseudolonga TaxID=143232 RepID=A0AAF0Y8B9_9TREE|nr:hypothetical protein LOC62_04G005308 [Vanrija pseudolonga]